MQRMRCYTITVLVALGLYTSAASCWAGFDEGVQAYERGDYATALREWRPLAEQGDASAQNNLGFMYVNGLGMAKLRVVGYALYNLSATNDPSEDNKAMKNRAALAQSMTTKEIEAGKKLTQDLAKQGNFLKILDQYVKQPTVKEKATLVSAKADAPPASAAASDPYPLRPAKRPGVVSCATHCFNADCWRTYDDGQKVRFQAKRKYDPFSGDWKWDSGGC